MIRITHKIILTMMLLATLSAAAVVFGIQNARYEQDYILALADKNMKVALLYSQIITKSTQYSERADAIISENSLKDYERIYQELLTIQNSLFLDLEMLKQYEPELLGRATDNILDMHVHSLLYEKKYIAMKTSKTCRLLKIFITSIFHLCVINSMLRLHK